MKTLLHLINPINGQIQYGDGMLPSQIGYLPQQTVVQKDFPASVWEIVLSGNLAKCGWRPFYSKQEKQVAQENMKRMDIWDLRKKCYRDLSGGQQQRVLLARCSLEGAPAAAHLPRHKTVQDGVVQPRRRRCRV